MTRLKSNTSDKNCKFESQRMRISSVWMTRSKFETNSKNAKSKTQGQIFRQHEWRDQELEAREWWDQA